MFSLSHAADVANLFLLCTPASVALLVVAIVATLEKTEAAGNIPMVPSPCDGLRCRFDWRVELHTWDEQGLGYRGAVQRGNSRRGDRNLDRRLR